MLNTSHPEHPVPLAVGARLLGVPSGWLRAEIEARRLPALIAGRAVLVHVPTIASILTDRARRGDQEKAK
jgi:hypothetical protein